MFQEFYSRSDHLVWPLVGLLIFLAVFAGVLAYTFFGLRDGGDLDEIAALPLADDQGPDEQGTDSQAERRAS